MRKTFLFLFSLIFCLSLFGADIASAEISADGCVTWDPYCTGSGSDAAVNFGWGALAQEDINEVIGGCALQSVNYAVEIVGEGTVGVGGLTNYTWDPLEADTAYTWRVRSDYQCSVVYMSGSLYSEYYSFNTPECNQPPNQPSTTSEENWNYCGIKGATVPTFEWTYSDDDGDPQQAYEIRINNSPYEDGFPSEPGPGEFTGSGGASTSFAPVPSEWSAWMNWSTNYWWIVRVQDNRGSWSEWSDQNPFRTSDHSFPWVDFSPNPINPVVDEVVEFIQNQSGVAETLCYDGGEHLCEADPNVTYEWDFSYNSDDGFITDSFNKGNTTTSYATVEPIEIRLKVTDNSLLGSNKSCTGSEMINVEFPLPEYEEVSPAVFLKKALVNLFDFFKGFVLLSNPEG